MVAMVEYLATTFSLVWQILQHMAKRPLQFVHDVELNGTSEYECFNCGRIFLAEHHPGSCEKCDSGVRNRGTPVE